MSHELLFSGNSSSCVRRMHPSFPTRRPGSTIFPFAGDGISSPAAQTADHPRLGARKGFRLRGRVSVPSDASNDDDSWTKLHSPDPAQVPPQSQIMDLAIQPFLRILLD